MGRRGSVNGWDFIYRKPELKLLDGILVLKFSFDFEEISVSMKIQASHEIKFYMKFSEFFLKFHLIIVDSMRYENRVM